MDTLPISKIVADPNQPRKTFPANEMRTLKESVKLDGIMNPLVVTEEEDGTFLLLDGERRYRVAKELDLKEVPVRVDKPLSPKERLVRQFSLQEQHAKWSPIEKANALVEIAKLMDATIYHVCEMLGMSRKDTELYAAFAEIADKKMILKNEVPLTYVKGMRSVKRKVMDLKEKELNEDFILSDEKNLEKAMVRSVLDGSVKDGRDLVKLKDAFTKNPKLIDEYIENEKATPSSMFVKAKAQGAAALRNLLMGAAQVTNTCRKFLDTPDVKISIQDLNRLKDAHLLLGKVIDLA